MTEIHDKPVALANEFSKVIREWLTEAQMAEVVRKNRYEYPEGICATHDYCDANMAMEEAGRNLGFTNIYDFDTDNDTDEKLDARAELWNRAWDLAKEADFQPIPERIFVAMWDTNFARPGGQNVTFDFFSDKNGYDLEDIEQINQLEVSETWTSHHYGPAHQVYRAQ